MTDMAGIIEPRHARCNATVDMAYAFPFDGQGPLDVASQQSMIISVHESVKDSSSKFQQRCWGRETCRSFDRVNIRSSSMAVNGIELAAVCADTTKRKTPSMMRDEA